MQPGKRSAQLIIATVCWAILFLLHAFSLGTQSTVNVEFDFTQLLQRSPYMIGFRGWELSPQGLVVDPSAEESVVMLGITKSRFDELLFELNPTVSGRGKVEVRVMPDKDSHVSAVNVPAGTSWEPPPPGRLRATAAPCGLPCSGVPWPTTHIRAGCPNGPSRKPLRAHGWPWRRAGGAM